MRFQIDHDGILVGHATAVDERLALDYDEGWRMLQLFPVSVSMPMTAVSWPAEKAHAFFANLLPEGYARESVCRRVGVSYENDIALLGELGGDTAGALRFTIEGEPTEVRERRLITASDLQDWSEGAPPLPTDGPIRLSLAGAQHKTSVIRFESQWALPSSKEASTHILKFDSERFKHLSENEFLTTRLAKSLGLEVAEVELIAAESHAFLAIRRYDRVDRDGKVERLHQEDFCQTFGLMPSRKYEAEGGPTLARVAKKIREVSSTAASDIQRLIRWVVFNCLAGNADGHAKNLSIVYEGRRIRLAPFYDLVCTRAFPHVDRKMAFRVGSARESDEVTRGDWERLGADLEVSPKLVLREVGRQLVNWEDAFEVAQSQLEEACPGSQVAVTIRQSISKRARAIEHTL